MGPLLNLSRVDAAHLMDWLYQIFHRDFVAQRTYLSNTIWIDPQSSRKDDGKELAFWHLTSRKQSYSVREGGRYITTSERLPDFRRSERLEWVKLIIDNHEDQRIKQFYFRENNDKRDVRLYLWAHQHDFVVILQKLGRSSTFLVTSFFIDHSRKKADYEQRYADYLAAKDPTLAAQKWF